uniref:Uncharacterized protein n=1 Tax=Anopheles atroparvus TaxID=41427 RepID=A0A182ILZ2_ANOAO
LPGRTRCDVRAVHPVQVRLGSNPCGCCCARLLPCTETASVVPLRIYPAKRRDSTHPVRPRDRMPGRKAKAKRAIIMELITTTGTPSRASSGARRSRVITSTALVGVARRPPAIMQPLAGVLLVSMMLFGHMQTSVLANAQPPTEKIPLAQRRPPPESLEVIRRRTLSVTKSRQVAETDRSGLGN